MRRILSIAFLGLGLICSQPAAAQVALPKSQVNNAQPVFCVDPSTGLAASCAGSVSATTTAKATAASPSYMEGTTTNPLSVDLGGFLRVRDDTLATLVAAPIPAGTNNIGSSPAFQNSSGSVLPPAGDTQFSISVSTATTTKVITGTSSKKTYVTFDRWTSAGAGTVKWVYGTGTNCGTGTTALTDAMTMAAGGGFSEGSGVGSVLIVPASQDTCITTTSSATANGGGTYAQY